MIALVNLHRAVRTVFVHDHHVVQEVALLVAAEAAVT